MHTENREDTLKNRLGMTDRFLAEAALHPELYPARVVSQYKDLYKLLTEDDELFAEVSGKFRFAAKSPSDYPAVGDFVMVDRKTGGTGNGLIHHMLSRKSVFIRRAAGTAQEEQVVASNVDRIFICMSLNNDFNLRRLERYLSIGWDSGAVPVVLLTKSDLAEDLAGRLQEVDTVAVGVDVLVTSAVMEDGYAQVLPYIQPGQTIAFIGSSGVGKSTLINRLAGEDKQSTKGLRNDDKGKHTTTRRELIPLGDGAFLLDTPGMRELGLESADLSKAFADIEEIAKGCRFGDCQHGNEPGCVVQEAVQSGIITAARLASYQKLGKERKYDGLNSKQIEVQKIDAMFAEVGGIKNARKFAKEKNKRKNDF